MVAWQKMVRYFVFPVLLSLGCTCDFLLALANQYPQSYSALRQKSKAVAGVVRCPQYL